MGQVRVFPQTTFPKIRQKQLSIQNSQIFQREFIVKGIIISQMLVRLIHLIRVLCVEYTVELVLVSDKRLIHLSSDSLISILLHFVFQIM